MAKKQSTPRFKRDVVKVEGQAPGLRPKKERIATRARIESYLLGDVILKRTRHQGLITKSEYRILEKTNAEHSGISSTSLFRQISEVQ